MKLKSLLFAMLIVVMANAQTGNFGIGTALPGSKLTVNGSISAPYKLVSANYTMTTSDYYVAYNGSGAGVITLPTAPAAYPAAGNIHGRIYCIKNTGTGTLSVATSGSELIDNQTGLGVASIGVGQGWFLMLISKGTTGATTTWEVMVMVPNNIGTIISMASYTQYDLPSVATFNAGTPQKLAFAASDMQVNQGSTATWDDADDCYIINEPGIYELDAFTYFGMGGTSGASSWIGVNMGITKNGTAVGDLIAGTRFNIGQTIAGSANSPIQTHCIVNLLAGDKLYLTLYKGFADNATGSVSSKAPTGMAEVRHFSLKKL